MYVFLDFRVVIIKKGEIVEAMPSKVILMMPKNQELSKFQRFKNLVSRIKIQDSRIKFQESRSRLRTQDSRIKRRLNQDKY